MIDYKISPTSNGQFSVVQIAKNGETLNTSETLTTVEAAMKNIRAVITGHNPSANTLFRVFNVKNKEVTFLQMNHLGDLTELNTAKMNKRQLKRFGL